METVTGRKFGLRPFRRASWVGWIGLLLAGWPSLSAETWTVMTYNAENYTLADRMVEGVYRLAYPKPEAAKSALRRTLRAVSPDVVVLQEVGHEEFLEELRRDLQGEGLTYPYAAVLEAADADRRIAMLSRRLPLDVRRHTDLTFPYFGQREPVKRGLLEIRYDTRAGPLTIFGVHLKSRFTDREDDPQSALRRAGEATAVRNRILERCADPDLDRFLVIGDFNDARTHRPVKAFLQRGDRTLTHLLPARDSRGEVWTHRYEKEDSYSRVDHILVSPALLSWVSGQAATIVDGPDVTLASDHRPVWVRLDLP